MKVSRKLIESFFNHTCTPGEARMVAEYLKNHPDVAARYLPAEEWDHAYASSPGDEDYWNEQWKKIERKRTARSRYYRGAMRAAAAIVIFLIAGVIAFSGFFKGSPVKNAHQPVAATTPRIVSVENQSLKVQYHDLPDGSKVELLQGSKILYREGFEADRRGIELRGEAVFSVAKDPARPFTVYTGPINTTAIGTRFKVVYKGGEKDIEVHLFEGKVLVQTFTAGKVQKAYLAAGEVARYDSRQGGLQKEQYAAAVPENPSAPSGNTGRDDGEVAPSGPFTGKSKQLKAIPMWYAFDGESLSKVFNQLADLYHAEIRYSENDLRNKYFAGKFEQTGSLEQILEMIADASGLMVEKKSSTHFIIRKK